MRGCKPTKGSALGFTQPFTLLGPPAHISGDKNILLHNSTEQGMQRTSWVTQSDRPSQNRGLEHSPVLIFATFSMAMLLNWWESIMQAFSPCTFSCPCTYCLCATEAALLGCKERASKMRWRALLSSSLLHTEPTFTQIQVNFTILQQLRRAEV